MASAAEIAETETEIAELTNQLAEAERMCQQQQDAASETEAKIAQLTNQLAAADKKEEEQEQEEEKKEEAFELSDSEDDDEEEDEMEVELAQMRADIAANDQAIKDLHLRIAASESVDAEMAAMRAQLELTEASVGAEEQATILACPDEGTVPDDFDLAAMLEQIAADEAALAALTATCGQREELEGEGEKLEAEIAGLQEEKWRLSQWNQLEQIKSVLIGGDGEQQEAGAAAEESVAQWGLDSESMAADEAELEAVMAQLQLSFESARSSEAAFQHSKEQLQREMESMDAEGIPLGRLATEVADVLKTGVDELDSSLDKLDSPRAA